MSDQLLLTRMKEELDKIISEFYFSQVKDKYETYMAACYTYSKCAEQILHALGYRDATVIRVVTVCGNEAGRRIFSQQTKAGKYDRDELIREGGWTIGIGVPPDFHYVVYFKKTKEILDLTFDSANRPDQNLEAKPFWNTEDQAPASIISIVRLNNNEPRRNFNPLWDYPELKPLFRKALVRIIEQLKSEVKI